MKQHQLARRVPFIIFDLVTKQILQRKNLTLLPGFRNRVFSFEALNRFVDSELMRDITESTRKEILCLLATTLHHSKMIGESVIHDFLICIFDDERRKEHFFGITEEIIPLISANPEQLLVRIEWDINNSKYIRDSYKPSPVRAAYPASSYADEFVQKVREKTARMHFGNFGLTQAVVETARSMVKHKDPSVEELAGLLHRSESTVKTRRGKLLDVGRDRIDLSSLKKDSYLVAMLLDEFEILTAWEEDEGS